MPRSTGLPWPTEKQVLAAEKAAERKAREALRAAQKAKALRKERYEATRPPTPAEAIFQQVYLQGLTVPCTQCNAKPDADCTRPNGTVCPMHPVRLQAGHEARRKGE